MTQTLWAQELHQPETFDGTVAGWLTIEDGMVVDEGRGDAPSGATVLGPVLLTGGFVDIQVNGIGPVDFRTADRDSWREAGRRLLAGGVTSYLPTLVTAPLDTYDETLGRVARAREDAVAMRLPHIEGVHLEGPFLGDAPGAHPPEWIRPLDLDWLTGLLDSHPGLVRLVTLAPEADPDFRGIRALVERDVVVALGHSRCTYETAVLAGDAGARLATHLFNGMAPMHHREPGLAGAALSNRLTPTLIADFVHVHPAMIRVAHEALSGRDMSGPILVTDAVATGVDSFGALVHERDGAAYLPDGTLAGSTLTMDQAVRNYAAAAGLSGLELAIDRATSHPSMWFTLPTYSLEGVGGRADLVALDVETHQIRHVWIAGEHVYGS